MSRNANATPQAEAEEIEERGERLAAFPRRGSRDKPASELRICLDSYEGHEYISIRLWEFVHGRLLPTKKGISIRLGEAREVIQALERAVDLAADDHRQKPTGGSPERPADQDRRNAHRNESRPPQRQPERQQPPPRTSPREVQADAFDDLAEFRRRR